MSGSACLSTDVPRPWPEASTGRGPYIARVHRGLEAGARVWQRIEADGHCTPFQRLDWSLTVASYLPDARPQDILVVEVHDEAAGRPVVVFPLIRRRGFLHTALTWPGADVCDYRAPLFDPLDHWTTDSTAAMWRAICDALPRADLLRIDHIPRQVAGATNPFVLLAKIRRSATTTCGLRLDGDPATVLERCCDPRFVKKLGKTGRRLAQRGTVRFVEARTEAEVHDLFDTLLDQRLSRFSELGRPDLLSQPHVAAFYRAAAIEGLHGGAVRLLGLRVGNEWAGTYYGLKHGETFQGLIVTIADSSWRTCSPGLHVHAHVVRWVAENGLTYFDMSVGPAAYKDQIGGQRSALYALDHAISIRGAAILLAMRAWARLKQHVRRIPALHVAAQGLRRPSQASPENPSLIERSGRG